MKKTLLIVCASIFIVCALVLAFYQATSKDEVSEKTFNDYVIEDYHSVVDTAKETTSVFFYEVETILNREIDSCEVDSISILYYKLIMQTEKNVNFICRDFVSDTRIIEYIEGDTWGGCFQIDSPIFPISFEQALINVKNSNYKTPHTKYMTLRCPLGSRYDNPIYIFGNSMNGGLCVDAFTGEVRIFE